MKLLTLNCHSWQEENQLKKIGIIANEIKENSYDVIALQEVNQSIDGQSIDDKIKENNFALVLLNELKKLGINDYTMIWDFSHIGFDIYEEGVALLTKHKIVKQDSFFISKNHDKNYWQTRKIIGASIKIDNEIMDFYSCHLGWWNNDEEPFKNQIDRLFSNIPFDKTTFLMGDFNNNAFIDGEGYSYVLEKGIYDTFHLADKSDEGVTFVENINNSNKKDFWRLDLILVNKLINVKCSTTIFNGYNKPVVSDHYGLEIEI